jgi:succinyl-diaminopimelate desuccinylase
VLAKIAEILKRFPQVRITEIESSVPHWSDPAHPLVRHLAANAQAIAGLNAQPIPSLAGTDARLWRQRGGPAFSYGVTATNVAMPDEHVDIEEWIAVVKTHALAALDYLSA